MEEIEDGAQRDSAILSRQGETPPEPRPAGGRQAHLPIEAVLLSETKAQEAPAVHGPPAPVTTKEEAARRLEQFGEWAARGADKAFLLGWGADEGRTLASTASAARTFVALFRACWGLDANASPPVPFNFDFASLQPPPAGEEEELGKE